MSRVARIDRLRDLIRASDRATVDELSAELSVSRRTLLRDLAYLREQGAPIEGEVGPGGGVRLLRDRGVAAVHLSLDEIASLWLAASMSRKGSALPWGGAATGALERLLSALPEPRSRELRALLRRLVVGPPASRQVAEQAGAPPPELLPCVERAFRTRVSVEIDYTDRNGNRTRRVVEPHGLLVQHPVWYLLARDPARSEPRMFRMDRISRPALLPARPFLPDLSVVRTLTEPLLAAGQEGAGR